MDCQAPYCRELLAILKHGEVRIRTVRKDRQVVSYHVVWIDDESGSGRTYTGDGETLREAVEAAILDRFGILKQAEKDTA